MQPPRRGKTTLFGGTLLVGSATVVVGALVSLLLLREGAIRDAEPRLSNPVQITTALGVEDYPNWSPDGGRLAYSAATSGDPLGGEWDVWVTQAKGGPTGG